jgi:hypothetical protein
MVLAAGRPRPGCATGIADVRRSIRTVSAANWYERAMLQGPNSPYGIAMCVVPMSAQAQAYTMCEVVGGAKHLAGRNHDVIGEARLRKNVRRGVVPHFWAVSGFTKPEQ